MCGISGHITLNKQKPNVKAVKKMLSILKHRGPSGQGEWNSGSVAIGMRRLSIIDVAGGDQPLYNEKKTIAIIGNGEIYNYKEIQTLLKKRGHKLRTGSDIETIAHLYEDEGVECFEYLRGMFALCLHDVKNNTVIIARDRIGEKPLYWTQTSDGIVFASEMKAILSFPKVTKTLRRESVQSFFAFYSIPEPFTAIEGIQKLEAGSYMRINTDTGKVIQKKYWDASKILTDKNYDPDTKLQNTLDEIGKITLRSDVPVGISLSGGLDSATVLALASKHSDKLKAFSVGYANRPKTDERQKAKKIADHFGVEFIEKEIKTEDMVRDFPLTVFQSDDPVSDIASYSIYAVAQLAREHNVPVLLGGIGGDELFWGYPWMQKAGKAFLQSHGKNTDLYESALSFKSGNLFLSLFATSTQKKYHQNENIYFWRPDRPPTTDVEYGRLGLLGIKNAWLQSDCLVLGDRMSMAASVELRLPLVDYKLVEMIYENEQTVTAFTRDAKYYLKQVMENILPQEILDRKKQGFTPPVAGWLYEILSMYMHLLEDGYLVQENILSPLQLKLLIKTWRTLPFLWYHLYTSLILEIWCRLYIWNQSPTKLSVS